MHMSSNNVNHKTVKDEYLYRVGMTALCMFASMNFCFWRASISRRNDQQNYFQTVHRNKNESKIIFES